MSLPRLKMEEQIRLLPIKTFSLATQLDRAVLTLNRLDFRRLHLQMPDHAGIIICTEDPDRVGQAQRITKAIANATEVRGQLIRVYRPE